MPPTLAFDYVALRDIKAGEELFLSYGKEWQTAWSQYRKNAKHILAKRSPQYQSAYYWNEKLSTAPIRTEEEQEADPYPEHVQVRCHYDIVTGAASDFSWKTDDYGFACSVLDRFIEAGQLLYTVDVELWPEAGYNNKRPEVDKVRRVMKTDVPRHALRFFDVPGTSDLHLSSTFRHCIGLPNDMLPDLWRTVELDDEDDE